VSEPPTVARELTAEELFHLRLSDKRTELVRGRLVVREPAGYQHGVVALRIARLLANYAHDHDLGIVVAAETGFRLFAIPDTVRAPDAAFITRGRAPPPSCIARTVQSSFSPSGMRSMGKTCFRSSPGRSPICGKGEGGDDVMP
jgi:Uma2 family endonuclease